MRIGFVHTVASVAERFRAEMVAQYPQADSFHVLDESLLQNLWRGENRHQVYRRMVQLLLLTVDDGADLLVLTSASAAPAGEIARTVCTTPILNVADPVSAEAVRIGRRIALLCTSTTGAAPAASILRQHAAAQGRDVIVETVVRPEAHTALFAGDAERHEAILTEAVEEVLPRTDVIVMAQASLAPMQGKLERLGKPVLASPALLMAEIGRRLAPESSSV